MKSKKLHQSFLLLIFFWLLSACSVNASQFQLKTDCDLPCWNLIRPGTSTKEEVLDILNNLKIVDSNSINDSGAILGEFDQNISFLIKSQMEVGSIRVHGNALFQNNQLIALYFYNDDIGMDFGDLIELIGTPNEVLTIGSRNGTPMIRITNRLAGVSFGNSMGNNKSISSETPVDFLLLFSSDKYETILQSRILVNGFYDSEETKKIVYIWKGYGNLDKLYPIRLP